MTGVVEAGTVEEDSRGSPWRFLWVGTEALLTLTVLASVVYVTLYFLNNGNLPQPFFYLADDVFMDWFNSAFWAHEPGAYTTWGSVYPPINFTFLKLTSLSSCYTSSAIVARDCDSYAWATMLLSYVACATLATIAFFRNDRRTALLRSIAFALGYPLLFTLERGNLILVALIAFIIATGGLLRSKWAQSAGVAVAINFKPYLILLVVGYIVKRRWRRFEVVGVLALAIYAATLAHVGGGLLTEIIENTRALVLAANDSGFGQMYSSTSFSPLLTLNQTGFPLLNFVGSRTVDRVEFAVPVLLWSSLAITVVALVAAWLQPAAVSSNRIAALSLGMLWAWQTPGSYVFAFLAFLLFLERDRRLGTLVALVAMYLLLISFDYILAPVFTLTRDSWLSGWSVRTTYGIAVGHFLRPGLLIIIVWALALDTIGQSWRAHRKLRPVIGLSAVQASSRWAMG